MELNRFKELFNNRRTKNEHFEFFIIILTKIIINR